MPKYVKKVSVDDNGEIVNQNCYKLYSPFKEGKGYNFKYKSLNIKSYLDMPLPEIFSDTEVGRLYRLSRYIYSDSNFLARRSNNEIKPLTKNDIQKIIGIHRNNFMPFWKKILRYKILKPVMIDGGHYYCFNPLYFNSTTYLPLYLFIAFQRELSDFLPPWAIEKYLDMHEANKERQKEKSSS